MVRVGVLRLNFGGTHEGPANLVPFKTIVPFLLGEKGWLIGGINIIGNIILLVPIGFLAPLVFHEMNRKKSLILAMAAGLAIEGTQAFLHVGIFDIDDVILNGLGVMLGHGLFGYFKKMAGVVKPQYKRLAARIGLVVLAVGIIFLVYQKKNLPVALEPAVLEQHQPGALEHSTNTSPQLDDPCNGTGGTGQITSAGNGTITIKRRDGVMQIIRITSQTKIRNSAGPATIADLKTGVRVTLVVGEEEDGMSTASHALICNEKATETHN